MDKRRRRGILAVLLALSVGNYFRIQGNENIRTVQFLSVFAIGVLTALLITELRGQFKSRKGDEDKMI